VIFENGYVSTINRLKMEGSKMSNKDREFPGFIDTKKEAIVEVALNENSNQVVLVVAPKVKGVEVFIIIINSFL
jgi:hypothetical protein